MPQCEKEVNPQTSNQESSMDSDPLIKKIPGSSNGENLLPDPPPSIIQIENELNNTDEAPPLPPRLEKTPSLSYNNEFSQNAIYQNQVVQEPSYNGRYVTTSHSNNGSFSSEDSFHGSGIQSQRIIGLPNGRGYSPTCASKFKSIPETSINSNFSPFSFSQTEKLERPGSSEESVQSSTSQSQMIIGVPLKERYSPIAGSHYRSMSGSSNSRESLPNYVTQTETIMDQSTNVQFSPISSEFPSGTLIPGYQINQMNNGLRSTSSEESIRNFISQSQRIIRPKITERFSTTVTSQNRPISGGSSSHDGSIPELSTNARISPLSGRNVVRPTSSEESIRNAISQSRGTAVLSISESYSLDPALQYRSIPGQPPSTECLLNTGSHSNSNSEIPINTRVSPISNSQLHKTVRPTGSEESIRNAISQNQRIDVPLLSESYSLHSALQYRTSSGSLNPEELLPNSSSFNSLNQVYPANLRISPFSNPQPHKAVRPTSSEESIRNAISQSQKIAVPSVSENYSLDPALQYRLIPGSSHQKDISPKPTSQGESTVKNPKPTFPGNGVRRSSSSEESFRSSVSQNQRNVAILYNERNSFSPFRPIPGGLPTESLSPSPGSQTGAIPRRLSNEKFSPIHSLQTNKVPGSSSSEESFRFSVPQDQVVATKPPCPEKCSPKYAQIARTGTSSSEGSFRSSLSQNQRGLLYKDRFAELSCSPFRLLTRRSSTDNFLPSRHSQTGTIPRRPSNEKLSTTSPSQTNRVTGSTSSEESLRCSLNQKIPEQLSKSSPVHSNGKDSLSSTASHSRQVSGASSSEESSRNSLSRTRRILESFLPSRVKSITGSSKNNGKFSPKSTLQFGPAQESSNFKGISSASQIDTSGPLCDEKNLPDNVSQVRRVSSNESFRSTESQSQKITEPSNKKKFSSASDVKSTPGPSNTSKPIRKSQIMRVSDSSDSSDSLDSFVISETSSSSEESLHSCTSQIKLSINEKITTFVTSKSQKCRTTRRQTSDSSSSSEESLKNLATPVKKTVKFSNEPKYSPTPPTPMIKSILRNSKKYVPPELESNPGPSGSKEFSSARHSRHRKISRSSSSEESSDNEPVPKRVEGRRSARNLSNSNPSPQKEKIEESSDSDDDEEASNFSARESKTEDNLSNIGFQLKLFARALNNLDLSETSGPRIKGRRSRTGELKCSRKNHNPLTCSKCLKDVADLVLNSVSTLYTK